MSPLGGPQGECAQATLLSPRPLHLLALTRYGPLGASSRMRLLQYLPSLERGGWQVSVAPLLNDDYLTCRYRGESNHVAILAGYAKRLLLLTVRRSGAMADCLWLEKELWPWAPAWLERVLLARRPWVLDLDDAIFHNYDRHRQPLLRWLYGRKIDRLMRAATVVTAGSPYLADRARQAGARDVRLVPTAVDLGRYPAHQVQPWAHASQERELVVGWIGSPATVQYLSVVIPALQAAARLVPLRLRVIGAAAPVIEGVTTESVVWTEDTEVSQICGIDVGIMPLLDSPWERGKCGYKLIQYMACRLPVVASPVGVNRDLVQPGHCGYLASNDAEWVAALVELARRPELRLALGRAGRERVEILYSTAITAGAVVSSVQDAIGAVHGH